MRTRRAVGAVVAAWAAVGTGSTAWAGGVGAVGNAAAHTTCAHDGPGPAVGDAAPPGGALLAGNVAQAPADVRRNSCGSTDVNIDVDTW